MQTVFNAGSSDGEGKPTKLIVLGTVPTGRHCELGSVIEIVANALELIELNIAEQPILKESLAASYPARRADGHGDDATNLTDSMTQGGNVTAVLVPLKTIARWRAKHDSKFQLEIERGVPLVVCEHQEFQDTLVNLVRGAEEAMGASAQLLVNSEQQGGVDPTPDRETSPNLRFYESCLSQGAGRTGQALSPLLSSLHGKGSGMAMAMEFELSSTHTATDGIAFRREAMITMRLRRIWATHDLANQPISR